LSYEWFSARTQTFSSVSYMTTVAYLRGDHQNGLQQQRQAEAIREPEIDAEDVGE
jgi:hypothetical protein